MVFFAAGMTDPLPHPTEPETSPQPAAARPAPSSKTDLFFSFSWLALQGFGGVLAVVQRELVDKKKWLTSEEFVEDWAVAQILPGPNVVNLSLMLGDRYFGLRGALAGVAGMLCFPLILVLLVAAAFAGVADTPQAQGALRGMGAVAAGLVGGAGLRLISALKSNVMGLGVCIALVLATFVAIAIARIPLAWVLLGIGGLGCVWAYVCLGKLAGLPGQKANP
jgi:chromate transporter